MTRLIRTIAIVTVTILISGFTAQAARQNTTEIKGVVFDKANSEPLGWATVILMSADSTIITGNTCDENGAYTLQATAGSYILKSSMIGYKDWSGTIAVGTSPVQMDPIYMSEDSEMLSGAVVTERVKLVEMKLDKLVMNISQSAFAQGSNALDLIRKAPGVTIDKDGNIKLNGKSVQIWIDGRPSYLDGKSLEALLRSTNGANIEKFEIMEHPSAKYDAAGQGGIINIKTKRNALSGLNGSLGADGGGMYFSDTERFLGRENIWTDLNYKTAKTRTFLNAYQGIYNTDINIGVHSITDVNGTPFDINSYSLQKDKYKNYQIRLGNDWFIDSKNTLGFIVTLPGSHDVLSSDRDRNNIIQKLGSTEIERAESNTENGTRSQQTNANINFTHIFNEAKGSEITFNADYYRNSDKVTNSLETFTQTVAKPNWSKSTRDILSDNVVNIYSAKVDFEATVWNFARLETGAKWALSRTDNSTKRVETGIITGLGNTEFDYREHIGAAYLSLAAQAGPKFSAKLGLRGEYTNSLGDWKTAGTQSKRDYFDLFPTAFVGYNPTQSLRLALSYTRRIQRPNYFALNPVENYIDAHSYTVGDPDLKAAYTDAMAFTVGIGQHFSIVTAYNHTTGAFAQRPELKENGDQLLTWTNYGRQDLATVGASIAELPITKWLLWTLNLNGVYSNSQNSDTATNESFSFMAYSCLTANLPADWKIQIDGTYQSPMVYTYFKLRGVYILNLGVRKTLLDGKLTISAKLDDVLRSMHTNLDILNMGIDSGIGTFVKSEYTQNFYSQLAHISLNWNFGKAQQTRRRNVGQVDEAARIGNNKGLSTK